MRSRFIRLGEADRSPVHIWIDGEKKQALEGDTLMVAILSHTDRLRRSEFGGESRSGLCLMGACQDCWVLSASGERLRACTTFVEDGMSIKTTGLEAGWSTQKS